MPDGCSIPSPRLQCRSGFIFSVLASRTCNYQLITTLSPVGNKLVGGFFRLARKIQIYFLLATEALISVEVFF